ncbi:L,D-transpeptidase [Streptomyces sp. NPDC048248]|uniref:L,D-transpeptidase n=1 Tax=Streptomyces sp. NPDC048248 TaxID=3365523 RepID=UPI003717413D
MKRTLPALLVGALLLTLDGAPRAAIAVPPVPGAAAETAAAPRSPQRPHQKRQRGVPGAASARCSRSTGPYQQQAERHLRRVVDGRQSAADCKAIRGFQRAHHITPANGFAGRVTGAVVRLLRAQRNPNQAGHCPVRARRVACIDLSRQLMWVQRGRKVIFRPVAIRSGRPASRTRTGTYRVYLRVRNHTSTLYNTPMPFSQFFDRGEALHGVYGDIYESPGSHGCVNLKWMDAERLWDVLKKGDTVHVWGRRTGV